MKKNDAQLQFDTIAIEGGLFTAEWLGKVASFKAPAQTDSEYGVRAGFSTREEIALAWRSAQHLWGQFKAARGQLEFDTWAVSQRFVSELLRQSFGFANLRPADQPQEIEGRRYPITHFAHGQSVPLVISTCTEPKLLDTAHDRLGDNSGDRLRRRSAFGLLQEYLNAEHQALWGIVSNGLLLRIARDNSSLTRPAWVEADLERLFEEENQAEFSVLWLLLHASRFGPLNLPSPASGGEGRGAFSPQDCILEQWRNGCREQGTQARGLLRQNVEQALEDLGQGFVSHPGNIALREALGNGSLSTREYFRQLLRLVYRMIFLLTVEERGILHPPGSAETTKSLFERGYSLKRLRDKAVRRSAHDRHHDLWEGLKRVWIGLAEGEPRLALPALGGLFASSQCSALDGAQLENRHLLAALFHLAWLRDTPNAPLTRVNWRDMGSEELGSIYESLLELTPQLAHDNRHFSFLEGAATKGNARKISGSYYTPDSLVQELLDSALEPVIADKLVPHGGALASGEAAAQALLTISVIDPACGSGHFILAAARRLGIHLARVLAEGGQPTPESYRHALRQVVTHCIFGVDLNPMAVELCKVALWLESIEPGRPLNFLDAHIRCGNALVGVHHLSVLREGVPNEAFSALKNVLADSAQVASLADDSPACTALRKRNSAERAAPTLPLAGLSLTIPEELDAALTRIDSDDASLADIEAKQQLFESVRAEGTLAWRLQRACDLWTAAFFTVKRPVDRVGSEGTPTSDAVWRFLADPTSLMPCVADATDEVSREYGFFHWPLEFPEVFKRGGFSLVLGNPPWETMSPDAKEFFAKYEPEISSLPPAAQQERIEALLVLDNIRYDWERHARGLYGVVRFIKDSGRYKMFAPGNLGKGDFNIYRMFVELSLTFVAPGGAAAQIVPENFYNGANASAIRAALFEKFTVTALFGFENTREVWFSGIDTRMKFALYAARRSGQTTEFPTSFSISSEVRLAAARTQPLRLPVALVHEFSPEAMAVMEFSNQLEINIARKMYGCFPRLGDKVEGLPDWHPLREVDMGNNNELFSTDPLGLPLYQGSMVTHHDYRAKGYVSGHGRNVVWEPLAFGRPNKTIQPQWRISPAEVPDKIKERIERYRIGFCDVGNSTNQRALMAALIPPQTVCGDKVPTIEFSPHDPAMLMLWLAVANTLVMDFIVRMKVALKMSMSLLSTLPFPREVISGHPTARVCALAARLSCAGPEMTSFLEQLCRVPALAGLNLSPCEDPIERARIAAELDAVVARELYGLTRDEMRYLLEPRDVLGQDCTAETFSALRRAEERELGEYRTARLVMREFDRLVMPDSAIDSYLSRLATTPEAQAEPEYSPIGVIRDEDDARLAGLVMSLIRQGGTLPRQHLTFALTVAQAPDTASKLLGRNEVDHLISYNLSHESILLPDRLSRIQLMLRFFEDAAAIRIEQQGYMIAVVANSPVLPGLIFDSDTEEIAGILLRAAQVSLDRLASAEPSTVSQPSSKQA